MGKQVDDSTRNLSLSDPFVLAVFSGFSYWLAYRYESGYAEAFGFPPELIDLRWTTIFAAGTVIIVAALGMAAAAVIGRFRFTSRLLRPVFETISAGTVGVLVLFGVVGISHWRIALLSWLVVLFLALVTSLLEAASYLISRSLRAEKPPSRETEHKVEAKPIEVAGVAISQWAFASIGFMIIAGLLAPFYSEARASDTELFLVTTAEGAPQAVLRIYGDKIVTAELDRETRTLDPIYHILPVTDSGRVFTVEWLPNVVPLCRAARAPDARLEVPKSVRDFITSHVDPRAQDHEARCERYYKRRDATPNPKA
jgi:MFS family permease